MTQRSNFAFILDNSLIFNFSSSQKPAPFKPYWNLSRRIFQKGKYQMVQVWWLSNKNWKFWGELNFLYSGTVSATYFQSHASQGIVSRELQDPGIQKGSLYAQCYAQRAAEGNLTFFRLQNELTRSGFCPVNMVFWFRQMLWLYHQNRLYRAQALTT